MDFVDYSPFPGLTRTGYSPTEEAFSYSTSFDKPHMATTFTSSGHVSFDEFESFFDRPVASTEVSDTFHDESPAISTTTQLQAPLSSSYPHSTPEDIDSFTSGFCFNATTTFRPVLDPESNGPSTPSLCGDTSAETSSSTSPSLSPRPQLKHESTSSVDSSKYSSYLPSNPAPRKRGRPRLDRSGSSLCSANQQRLPHNQVERKYREGLNASLERLRRTIPSLCQDEELGLLSRPRPSKSMILAGAIEYIKTIERERDALREECERLRSSGDGGWATTGLSSDGL